MADRNIDTVAGFAGSIASQRRILETVAEELAAKSDRWRYLFSLARLDGVENWNVVLLLRQFDEGKHISQEKFVYARLAKLVATTEEWKISENLITKKDVVSWNRQAILAMVEAEKNGELNLAKIERGYKAIEIINILYPEFLLK